MPTNYRDVWINDKDYLNAHLQSITRLGLVT